MRPLLVAVLLVAPLAGCIVDPPTRPLDPSSVAPEPEPEDAPPAEARDEEETREGPPPEAPTPPPSPQASPAPAPAPAPPAPVYLVEWRFGNVTAGAGASTPEGEVCCVHAAPADPAVVQAATVAGGATAFLVELRWTSPRSEASFDLDLVVKAPDYREAEPAPPSADVPPATPDPTNATLYTGHRFVATDVGGGLARILVDDPAVLALAGEWTIEVAPKGPAAAVPFELAMTSVLRLPPAADYSAFA